MIHLKFKNANTMAYSIVEIENKKYIMDLGSMKGKRYFLGLIPNLITLDMIELTPSDDSFEIKSKTKIGTTTISIMVQPFVALLYRAMNSAFISMGLSQQIFMKSILFGAIAVATAIGTESAMALATSIALGTTPVGWTIAAGVAISYVVRYAYNTNFLGIKDIANEMGDNLNKSISDVGKAFDSGIKSIQKVFGW